MDFKKYSDKILKGGFSLIIFTILITNAITFVLGRGFHTIDTLVMTILFLTAYLYSEKLFINKASMVPPSFFYISMIFGFFSTFLGSYLNFYELFEFWDDLLHFISGILLGILCIIIITYVITKRFGVISRPIDILAMVVFGVLISISIAVFWEFYEFAFDYLFDGNMQRSIIVTDVNSFDFTPYIRPSGRFMDPGLLDTMGDFLQAVAGAILAGVYCYMHFSLVSSTVSYKNK